MAPRQAQRQRQRQGQPQRQVQRSKKLLAAARSTALNQYLDEDAQDNEAAYEPGLELFEDVQQEIEGAEDQSLPPEEQEVALESEAPTEDTYTPASEYGEEAPGFEPEPSEPAEMPGPWDLDELQITSGLAIAPRVAITVRVVRGRVWAAATPPFIRGLGKTGSKSLDHTAFNQHANPEEAWENLQALGEYLVEKFPEFFLCQDRKQAMLKLRSLTQKEVANQLRGGISEATVSRMAAKYIDTPYLGILPIKVFFQVTKAPAGKRVTKYQMLEAIKDIFASSGRRLPAQRIADILDDTKGIVLSREYISRLMREHKLELLFPKDKSDQIQ